MIFFIHLHEDKEAVAPICSHFGFIYLFIVIIYVRFQIIQDAQILSARMNHRGACACDNDTGDGAGVLCAIPHDYYANEIR